MAEIDPAIIAKYLPAEARTTKPLVATKRSIAPARAK
jgi:hypothetical protein